MLIDLSSLPQHRILFLFILYGFPCPNRKKKTINKETNHQIHAHMSMGCDAHFCQLQCSNIKITALI